MTSAGEVPNKLSLESHALHTAMRDPERNVTGMAYVLTVRTEQ